MTLNTKIFNTAILRISIQYLCGWVSLFNGISSLVGYIMLGQYPVTASNYS